MKGKILDQINTLKKIARFGKTIWRESPSAAVRILGTGKKTVSFLSAGVLQEFRTITTTLYSLSKTVQIFYTLENFIYELVNLLRVLNEEKREANNNDWNNLISSMIAKPDIEIEIALPIYGVFFENSFMELGDFKIYSRVALKNKYPNIKRIKNEIVNSEYFLTQMIKAKSIEKCKEEANKNFLKFENVANFITAGFHKTYKISLLNNWFSTQVQHLIFTGNKILHEAKTLHRFRSVSLENPYFADDTNGYGAVWKLITANRNDLQNKILESIEWSGKASVETDDNKALLLYIIAIEAILNYTHNSSLYTPITVSLADSVAFLLGKNKQSRIQYAKYIIDLYRIRSGIVHGSIREISQLDLHTAFSLSHQIIKKILSELPYRTFTSKKMLSEYLLKEKKYDMGEIAHSV